MSRYAVRREAVREEAAQAKTSNIEPSQAPSVPPVGESPLLITIEQASRLVSISVRTIRRMMALKQFPEETRIGGSVRWRRADIEQWVAAGCPKLDNRR